MRKGWLALGVLESWRSSLSVWRSSASLSAQQQWSQVSVGQLRPRDGPRRHSSLPSTPNTPSEVPPPVSGLTLALAGGPQAPSAEQERGNEGTRGCSLSSAPLHAPGVLVCVLIGLSLRPQLLLPLSCWLGFTLQQPSASRAWSLSLAVWAVSCKRLPPNWRLRSTLYQVRGVRDPPGNRFSGAHQPCWQCCSDPAPASLCVLLPCPGG